MRKPLELDLVQGGIYHDPSDDSFSSNYGGLSVVRCITSPQEKEILLVDSKGKRHQSMRSFRGNNYNIYEFGLLGSSEYSFQSTEGTRNGPFTFHEKTSEVKGPNVTYQIFPDRFRRSGKITGDFREWDNLPDSMSFFGGDAEGIREKLPYLKQLGVDHIYLTPFYRSQSNHRYDVDDYYSVDPRFGSNDDLITLSSDMKGLGMDMIIDMVFNHSSTRFERFVEALNNPKSKDREWYTFLTANPEVFQGRWPLRNGKRMAQYEAFKDFGGMPKLNHSNSGVLQMMLDVMNFWNDRLNVSYFRYDVADSIDISAMEYVINEFRKKNPVNGYIAEVWCLPFLFTKRGPYDSSMNYPLRELILNLVQGKISARKFNREILRMKLLLGDRVMSRMMNILGTHDTERVITRLGSKEASLLSYAILFLMDGMPTIYYGDETGLQGGKDPDCRRSFPWTDLDHEMIGKFTELSKVRRDHPSTWLGHARLVHRKNGLFEMTKSSGLEITRMIFSLSDAFISDKKWDAYMTSGVRSTDSGFEYRKYSFAIGASRVIR